MLFWSLLKVLIVSLDDLCSALGKRLRFPTAPLVQALDLFKQGLTPATCSTGDQGIVDIEQYQSDDFSCVVAKGPQAWFRRVLNSVKFGEVFRYTLIPSPWRVDQAVDGFQQSNTLVMF